MKGTKAKDKLKAGEIFPLGRNDLINILKAMDDGIYIVSQHYDIEFINHVIQREFGEVAGRKCYTYFHDRTEVCPWCKNQEVFAGKSVRWEWYSLKNKKFYDLLDTPLKNSDGTISKLEIFRDITERKQAEEKLEKQNQKLSSLNTIASIVGQSLDIKKVLSDTLATVLDLMGLKGGWIFQKCEEKGLTLVAHKGLSAQFVKEESGKPQAGCICFKVIRKKKPLIVENILKCSRLSKSVIKKEGLACHASVPLISKNKVVGVMNVASEDYRPFLPEDLNLLTAIGHQVGMAIENAQLFEAARKKTYELENAYEKLKAERERANSLSKALEEKFGLGNIIGKNHKMQTIYDLIENISQSDSTALIQGESGTGKELIAQAIHLLSPRKEKPLVIANCSAYSQNLLESELFGHEKGAFTGAIKRKQGRFELAHEGTIFLDEIGEIQPSTQLLLLRVLQERKFERVGGEETLKINVRVIAATNRDLKKEMIEGRFREDLYYRLSVIPLLVPPLRERKDDIPLLAEHFLEMHCKFNGKKIKGFSKGVMQFFFNYNWPGNVRELQNVVEHAVILAKGDMIIEDDLPLNLKDTFSPSEPDTASLKITERNLILKIMQETKGNKYQAAKKLGITRSTLYGKLRKHGIMASGE